MAVPPTRQIKRSAFGAATDPSKPVTSTPPVTTPSDDSKSNEQHVGVDSVSALPGSTLDYNKLIQQFGCTPIDAALLARLERVTGKPAHTFLRRGLFFSHRDFDKILDEVEAGREIYLYTGRGPSAGSMHLGHLVPFFFTKYLQDVFDCHVVIQITDDEKLLKKNIAMDVMEQYCESNIKDIIAVGFNPHKTFIFRNLHYMGQLYPTVVKLQAVLKLGECMSSFGIVKGDCIGKAAFGAVQAAPCFASSFPDLFGHLDYTPRCLVPCGIDQDPYFRLTRDACMRLRPRAPKPAVIHSRFLPALSGVHDKMSSSVPSAAVFLTDSAKAVKKKVNKFAVSGGCELREEQEVRGANLAVDVPFHFLRFFEEDDKTLAQVEQTYGSTSPAAVCPDTGKKMLTGAVKKRVIALCQALIKEHQRKRALITQQDMLAFASSKSN